MHSHISVFIFNMAIDHLLQFKSTLQPEDLIEPSSPSYRSESLTWAAQKNLQPRLVVRPTTFESLSKILAHLSKSPLDFAVRSQGFGSSSAKDVLISMTAFDEFEFDREKEVVTVGAGQTWEGYYKKMEETAPEYNGMSAFQSGVKAEIDPRLMIDSRCLSNALHWNWGIHSLRWFFLAVGRVRAYL